MSVKASHGDCRSAVLSFHDSLLRVEDLSTLKKGAWLNDNIISFYLQYLEFNVFKNLDGQAAFVAAEVVQLMKHFQSDELSQTFGYLANKKLVLLPLNNCQNGRGGGSHWSLLVFYNGKFYHMDSAASGNSSIAKRLAEVISPFISDAAFSIEETPCPSQTNCTDCGVYVLEFAELACQALAEGKPLTAETFKNVSSNSIERKRSLIENIILELSKSSEYTHRII